MILPIVAQRLWPITTSTEPFSNTSSNSGVLNSMYGLPIVLAVLTSPLPRTVATPVECGPRMLSATNSCLRIVFCPGNILPATPTIPHIIGESPLHR